MSIKLIKSLLFIALGSAITAFGIINFAVTNELSDGGFTGVTLILLHTFGISTAFSNLLLNIPMLLVGYHQFNKKTFCLTIFGTLTLSLFLGIFERIGPLVPSLKDDMILAAIGYGVVVGTGVGIIFREGGTTGGSDILAKLAKDKLDIPIAQTLFNFDIGVIIWSLLVFLSFSNAIYTLIGLFIYAQVIAKLQEGFHSGYQVLIISSYYKEITPLIQAQLNRSATFINGTGAYTKEDKRIILIVISKKQLFHLKKIIYSVDPQCFITISHVFETLGEGFSFEKAIDPS